MKKILFPTEFSAHASEVFKYAAEIAYFFNARLIVMHAFGKPQVRPAKEEDKIKKAAAIVDRLTAFANGAMPEAYRAKVKVSYFAPYNYPAEAVLDLAIDQEVDLIVMGMTGKTDAIGTIFGSTALGVLAKSDCPVLAIPTHAKFEGIDNLVYTTNFEFRDLAAINYLKKWSELFEAPIHCLHVLERNENEARALINMNILSETYKNQDMIAFDMAAGDFQKEIEGFAKRKRADIVAMMAHKRNFISRLVEGSSVKDVARRIHIPLLVVKDNAYEWEGSAEWLNIVNSIA